jgi:hypothetical protein
MKHFVTIAFLAAASLNLAGCSSGTAVSSVNNSLANLAKNDIPAACLIVDRAEGYFAVVAGLVPAKAVTAEKTAAAIVATICAAPPTDVAAAFATLLQAWTTIQAATTVPAPTPVPSPSP